MSWRVAVGQIAAVREQLPPEAFGRGLERHRTKRVAHLPQQHRQMASQTAANNRG